MPLTKRHSGLTPYFITLVFLANTGGALAIEYTEIKSLVDVDQSSGCVVVENLVTNNPPTGQLVTVYEWDHGDFLAETFLKGQDKLTNAIFSSGSFLGTNWSHRTDALIYYSVSSKAMEELARSLGGRRPERHFFEKINGRGIDSGIFKSLNLSENRIFGTYQEVMVKTGLVTLNISGEISQVGGPHSYEWTYKIDGFDFHYVTEFILQSLSSSNWFPVYLKTRIIHPNAPEQVINEFRITEIQGFCRHASLSPEELYKPRNVYSSSNLVLTPATKNTRPVVDSGATRDSGKKAKLLAVVIFLLISVGFACVFCAKVRK